MGKLVNLYCIVGPSGSGKTTLANMLQKMYGIKSVVSYTTRPMRDGEVYGGGRYFVTEEEFKLLDVVTYAETCGYKYGTTRQELDNSDIYLVDIPGVILLTDQYTDREVIVLGLDTSGINLVKRMRERGDAEDVINRRLNHDSETFNDLPVYCNEMLNASLNNKALAEQAWAIICGYEPGKNEDWVPITC